MATLLTTRLKAYKGMYVHSDQMGFLPNRYLKNSTHKFKIVINLAQLQKEPTVLYFIDAKKAYNMVEWQYLKQVLVFMVSRKFLRTWNDLIYTDFNGYALGRLKIHIEA